MGSPVETLREMYEREKARADAAEHWKATYYAETLAAREALAAARRECEGLRDRVREVRADMTPTNMQYEAPYLRQWIVSWARTLDAALAAPAAGEEGKR